MRAYTAHLAPHRDPVLLAEGFSVWAFLFGPAWLLWHRAWIPGAVLAAAWVVLGALPVWTQGPVMLTAMLLAGVLGRDWVRWSLERRGFLLAHVLAARDGDAAFARLLAARPDLAPGIRDRGLGDGAL